MKKFTVILMLMVPILALAQTQVPPGPVSGTWDLIGSPYIVNGDITVRPSTTLIIEPGVEVRFTEWYKFIVQGSLIAGGSEDGTILFTAHDKTIRWAGIRIYGNSSTILLDHCTIEYGSANLDGSYPESAGGGICMVRSSNASITISHSRIQNNIARSGGGIECDASNPTISDCIITNNIANIRGGGLQLFSSCQPLIRNSVISHNRANEGGGLSCEMDCTAEFTDNIVVHNSAVINGGGMALLHSGGFIAKNNLFAYNSAMNGGAVELYGAEAAVFSDNTFAYNAASHTGGAISLSVNTNPTFTSDIMYFNTALGVPNQVHIAYTMSVPSFYYCDVEGGIAGFTGAGASPFLGEYENCISGNPLFANPSSYDFTLTWDNYPVVDLSRSPCIDSGREGLLTEPDHTRNDIGAFFFFQRLDVPEALEPEIISKTSFLAEWSSAYGALSYFLDVALDEEFSIMFIENVEIPGDTSFLVENLNDANVYYYRLRAHNTSLTSDYSNTQSVLMVSVKDVDREETRMYTSCDKLVVITDPNINGEGEIWIYNVRGQLITYDRIQSGWNQFDPLVSDQIIIVKVIYEGKACQKKLLMH